MFPGFNLAYSVLYPIAGRVVLKEIDVTPDTRTKIKKFSHKVRQYSKTFDGFDLSNPFTWVTAASDLVDMAVEEEDNVILTDMEFLSSKGYELVENIVMPEIADILKVLEYKRLHKRDGYEILKIRIPGEDVVFERAVEGDAVWSFFAKFEEEGSTNAEVRESIRKFMCKKIYGYYGNFLSIKYDQSEFSYVPTESQVRTKKFYGKQKNIIKYLRKAKEKGIRRSILFQGRPGMGKSVLCSECARELNLNTISINNDTLSTLNMDRWREIITFYKPKVIIIDDIDRVKKLESKLSLFEEDNIPEVDFILFTSNKVERIPEAFRRPGRIDRIIMVEPPDRETTIMIVNKLAKRENAYKFLNEEKMEYCIKLAKNLSFTHVVEYLRQLYIFDGEIQTFEGDRTFEQHGGSDFYTELEEEEEEDTEPEILDTEQEFKQSLIDKGIDREVVKKMTVSIIEDPEDIF